MRNIKMTVSYIGTNYSGFQCQTHGNTVQDRLERSIYMLTREEVKIHSSGRTDAGVHAKGQVFHFKTSSVIPISQWCFALNARLPGDIVVVEAEEAPPDFHSRHCAKQKTYCYAIQNSPLPNVFQQAYRYHYYSPLDEEAMRKGLAYLVGEHDFTAYCSAASTKESHVRTIFHAELKVVWEPRLDGVLDKIIQIWITGNGFLYHMVRIIVGTLIQVGSGKRPYTDMKEILESKDRQQAGPTAMAHGLTLWSVVY